MGRYPRGVRKAQIKCINCNAPVTKTTENEFICVECGSQPVQHNSVNAD